MHIRNSLLGLLGLVALSFATSSMAQGVYKWEDENGQVHFSDMPREGAVEIEIAPVQTFDSGANARTSRKPSRKTGDRAESAKRYNSFEISSPSQEETIWNTGGAITVKTSLSPTLQAGHSMMLYLNGQQQEPFRGTSAQLSAVERGTHSLRAEVRDKTGKVVIKSDNVTFYLKQQTVDQTLPVPGVTPGDKDPTTSVKSPPNMNTLPQRTQKNRPRPTPN